jgi:hypothetical protein
MFAFMHFAAVLILGDPVASGSLGLTKGVVGDDAPIWFDSSALIVLTVAAKLEK